MDQGTTIVTYFDYYVMRNRAFVYRCWERMSVPAVTNEHEFRAYDTQSWFITKYQAGQLHHSVF